MGIILPTPGLRLFPAIDTFLVYIMPHNYESNQRPRTPKRSSTCTVPDEPFEERDEPVFSLKLQ